MTLITEIYEGGLAEKQYPSFNVGEGYYKDFFDVYAQSEYGIYQRGQQLRYEVAFGCYDREQMVLDLGDDVDPVDHMLATERTFVELMQLVKGASPEDIHIGRLAALVHDIGECMHPSLVKKCGAVVGDIPHGKKTPEQRAAEMNVWDTLMSECHGKRLSESDTLQMRQIVTHEAKKELGEPFDAAHDTNSLRVGLRAGELALQALRAGDTQNERFEELRTIGTVVCRVIVGNVERYAQEFILPDRVLTDGEALFNEIQAELG